MKTAICLVGVSVLALGMTACSSQPNVKYNHIVNNLTPEMKGTSERPSDDTTAYKYASNKNWRLFWDDLGRTFLVDSPSRLSPVPIITASGQHR